MHGNIPTRKNQAALFAVDVDEILGGHAQGEGLATLTTLDLDLSRSRVLLVATVGEVIELKGNYVNKLVLHEMCGNFVEEAGRHRLGSDGQRAFSELEGNPFASVELEECRVKLGLVDILDWRGLGAHL